MYVAKVGDLVTTKPLFCAHIADSSKTAVSNCFIVFIYIFYTNGRKANIFSPPLGFLLYYKFKTTIPQSQKMNEKLIFLIQPDPEALPEFVV